MAPRVQQHLGTRPTERTCTVDERILAHPRTPTEEKLAKLEERLDHELMDDEERQELRDRVIRLRQRLGL
jgi:hypothetical protein